MIQLRRAPGESDLLRKGASFHEHAAALRSRHALRSQLLGGHRAEGPRGFAKWQMPDTVAADHEHIVKSSENVVCNLRFDRTYDLIAISTSLNRGNRSMATAITRR